MDEKDRYNVQNDVYYSIGYYEWNIMLFGLKNVVSEF